MFRISIENQNINFWSDFFKKLDSDKNNLRIKVIQYLNQL